MSTEALIDEARRWAAAHQVEVESARLLILLSEALEASETERERLDGALKFSWLTEEDRERKFSANLREDPTHVVRLVAAHFMDILDRPSITNADPASPGARHLTEDYQPVSANAPPAQNYVEMSLRHETRGTVIVTIRRWYGKTPNQLRIEAEADRDRWEARAEAAEARAEAAVRALGPVLDEEWERNRRD